MKPIKVLIVEDSKLMQQLLYTMLSSDPEIRVIGIVSDPLLARDLIKKTNPDVLTLDIMLPYMDGITFLKNLMRLHPMPVVMISALTETGSAAALEALAIGAVDYLHKPANKELKDLTKYTEELVTTVKNAARANILKSVDTSTQAKSFEKIFYNSELLNKELIVIGASTGGIEAIENILMKLPKVLPPIIIIQHIKKQFSTAFARRMTKLLDLNVMEAEDYSEISPGKIYIAPGDHHVIVKKRSGHLFTTLNNDLPVMGHKPSIDVLFNSVAKAAGPNCIGILLTGMGADGAQGLKAIRDAGGATIAQDQESSLIWGMPGAAVKIDAAEFIVPLSEISQKILQIIDDRALKLKPKR